jgi:hypothetical protein
VDLIKTRGTLFCVFVHSLTGDGGGGEGSGEAAFAACRDSMKAGKSDA